MIEFNLQFFGNEQVRKRDPMHPLLEGAYPGMFGDLKPFWDSVISDKAGYENARKIGNDAMGNMGGLMDRIPGMMTDIDANNARWNAALETGAIPQTLQDNMYGAIQKGLNQSTGSMLNRLGAGGTINSTGMNTGLNNLTRNAADAMQSGYLDTYRTMLGGYGNYGNNMNQTMANTFSGIDSLGKVPGVAMNAFMAPAMPFYNLVRDWQNSYDQREDYDTVVHQGK